MRIARTTHFDAMFEQLPVRIQKLFDVQTERLAVSPRDPRLHLKKLAGKDDAYSIRLTREFRALFAWDHQSATFFSVGARKDIYR